MTRRPCFSSTPSIPKTCAHPEKDKEEEQKAHMETCTTISSGSSSQISIYCTPPSSLGFPIPASSSNEFTPAPVL